MNLQRSLIDKMNSMIDIAESEGRDTVQQAAEPFYLDHQLEARSTAASKALENLRMESEEAERAFKSFKKILEQTCSEVLTLLGDVDTTSIKDLFKQLPITKTSENDVVLLLKELQDMPKCIEQVNISLENLVSSCGILNGARQEFETIEEDIRKRYYEQSKKQSDDGDEAR